MAATTTWEPPETTGAWEPPEAAGAWKPLEADEMGANSTPRSFVGNAGTEGWKQANVGTANLIGGTLSLPDTLHNMAQKTLVRAIGMAGLFTPEEVAGAEKAMDEDGLRIGPFGGIYSDARWDKTSPLRKIALTGQQLSDTEQARINQTYKSDPARANDLSTMVAGTVGKVAPMLAGYAINPAVGAVGLVGQSSDAARSASRDAGETPDMQQARAEASLPLAAAMSVIPGVAIGKTFLGRVASGGAIAGGIGAAGGAAQRLAEGEPVTAANMGKDAMINSIVGGLTTAAMHAPGAIRAYQGKKVAQAAEVEAYRAEQAAAATAKIRAAALREQLAQDAVSGINEVPPPTNEPSPLDVYATRVQGFKKAKTEMAAEDLQTTLRQNQIGEGEIITLEGTPAANKLLQIDTGQRRGNSARETVRLESIVADETAALQLAGAEVPSETQGSVVRDGRVARAELSRNSRSGAIDAGTMHALARAALGGTLGYATGDTDEEKIRNALIGAGIVGASPQLLSAMGKLARLGMTAAQQNETVRKRLIKIKLVLNPISVLSSDIVREIKTGNAAKIAVTNFGLAKSKDLEAAINTLPSPAAKLRAVDAVDLYLNGHTDISTVPATVRAQAQAVREHIDAMTLRAVAEGAIGGVMANTFMANEGSYMRATYDAVLNPKWKPDPAKVQTAIAAVKAANSGMTRAEAEGIVAGIIDNHDKTFAEKLGSFLSGNSKVAGKDVSTLIRRKDLLPEIKDLLGEVKNPLVRANQTMPRIASLVEGNAAQIKIRDIGLATGLFSPQRSLTHPTPLVPEGSATHHQLAGLYAPPEIVAALRTELAAGGRGVAGLAWKSLATYSGLAKITKTVLSPISYAPNFFGGVATNLYNGNFRYDFAKHAILLQAEDLGLLRLLMPKLPSRPALQAEIAELTKKGVLGQSVNREDFLRGLESSFFARMKDKTKAVASIPFKVYGGIDDLTRYVAYKVEQARYAKAFPNKTPEQIADYAADITRLTQQTYSEVPRVMKDASVIGVTPSFVSFVHEVFRNTFNSARVALNDIQVGTATNNPELVNIGRKRLAAMTVVLGASSAAGVSWVFRKENGVTDEQEQATRELLPPWNYNGSLVFYGNPATSDQVRITDSSYLLPHTTMLRAFEAAARGADENEATKEFFSALMEQFGPGNSVALPSLIGALTGRDIKTGNYIPKTDVKPTLLDRSKFIWEAGLKPGAWKLAQDYAKASSGKQGDYGVGKTKADVEASLLGVRSLTFDKKNAVAWQADDLADQMHEANQIFRLRQKRDLSPDALNGFYEDAEKARQIAFNQMTRLLKNARTLNVPDEETIGAMRDAHIPAETILGVLDGTYVPLVRDKEKSVGEAVAELMARPENERRAAMAAHIQADPEFAKAMAERIVSPKAGQTEQEKLIASLGVMDGSRAKYLNGKIATMSDAAARAAYLKPLRANGILTDAVLRQMAAP